MEHHTSEKLEIHVLLTISKAYCIRVQIDMDQNVDENEKSEEWD